MFQVWYSRFSLQDSRRAETRSSRLASQEEEAMSSWPYGDDSLRAMYRGGRADATARRLARMWAALFGLGLAPRRWVTLEVAGRRSGRIARFPLGMADRDGQWYLVPMLGEQCNWVQNVRSAGGRATLRHRRAVARRLVEVPVSERAPIIKRYLEQVPGARPHIPVNRRAPVADFEAIAPRYPVFRVAPPAGPGRPARKRHRWRWIVASVVALILLVVLAVGLFIKLQPSAAALALPQGAARPPRARSAAGPDRRADAPARRPARPGNGRLGAPAGQPAARRPAGHVVPGPAAPLAIS
jgi:F420H(2)-dependent quinone reductase